MNLHIWAWSKIFGHIQIIFNTVKKNEQGQKVFELADGLGISFDFENHTIYLSKFCDLKRAYLQR